MPLAGSSPGSDAFYCRSMRKGTGGDAEGEAMRANLTFQNTLRVEAHGAGTPDASQTLSAKRSRRARERAAHVSTPTEAEVDALLMRLADGSPSLLKAGITPPKPAWVPPKPAAADAAAFPAWLPVEAMPPARDAAAGAAAKTPPKPTRAIHFATPGEATTAPAEIAARATRGDVPADRSSRLPIFERLYRQVPSGQRAKFGFPEDASRTGVASPRAPFSPNATAARKGSPKDLREKRREIALLTAELAAREAAEAAGAADAAAAVAAEMARRGGLLPRSASEPGDGGANASVAAETEHGLALAEAAARDALERILRSPDSNAVERSPAAGASPAAFGSPTDDVADADLKKTRAPGKTPALASGGLASDPDGVDWRFADGAFELGGGGATPRDPWRERALRAEPRRRAKAAAWEGEVRARAAAKAQTQQLVDDAERELGRLRRRRAEIVTRQMHARALANAKADGTPKREPRARAPWGPLESTGKKGALEKIRNAATSDNSSPKGSPGMSPPAAERSPLMASPTARAYGAADEQKSPRGTPSRAKARATARVGPGVASGAEAARLAAARVRARERAEAKAAAHAAAAAAAKAQAEMFRARRAAEREKKSRFSAHFAAEASERAASSFLAPTAASVGKAARVPVGNPNPNPNPRARRSPAAARARGEDATRARSADAEAFSRRVDALERDVGLVRTEVAASGEATRAELEGLRAQMAAVLEMLSVKHAAPAAPATGAERVPSATHRGVSVTGSPVKSTPPTPPRGAPPPRVDAKSAPAFSPPRAPAPRGGPSPAASPRAAAIPAERAAEIPAESANPFLSG